MHTHYFKGPLAGYSSEEGTDATPDSEIADLREYIAAEGLDITIELTDETFEGTQVVRVSGSESDLSTMKRDMLMDFESMGYTEGNIKEIA